MTPIRVEDLQDNAEGDCCGIPYTTELMGAQSVSVHFWVDYKLTQQEVAHAVRRIRSNRDVVRVTWSRGQPLGYWAQEHID